MVFIIPVFLFFLGINEFSHGNPSHEFYQSPGKIIKFDKERCSLSDFAIWCKLKGDLLIEVCGERSTGTYEWEFVKYIIIKENGKEVVLTQKPEVFVENLCRKVKKTPRMKASEIPDTKTREDSDVTSQETPDIQNEGGPEETVEDTSDINASEVTVKKAPSVFDKPYGKDIMFDATECSHSGYNIMMCKFKRDLLIEVCGEGTTGTHEREFTRYSVFTQSGSEKVLVEMLKADIKGLCEKI